MKDGDGSGRNLAARRVIDLHLVAEATYLLSFEATAATFEPGAIVGLALDAAGPLRWYSLAGGAREETMQVVFDLLPAGALTPGLSRLKPGDSVLATSPSGEFRDGEGTSLWLAAGTGIAPFRSMLRSGRRSGKSLFHAARTRKDFLFSQEFEAAAGLPVPAGGGEPSPFRYLRCASRDAGAGLYPGRLTSYLAETPELPRADQYLICGSADFVVDVRDVLIGRGIPFPSIVSETYF